MNTAIFGQSGGNIGTGFAIPATLARPVIDELRNNGRVTRGYLGVTIQPVTPEAAQALDLKDQSGALVAGPHELTRMVAQTKPGDTARVVVLRDGKPVTFEARIAEQAEAKQQPGGEGRFRTG